jgi:predicted nucleic acid-binding protein
VRDGAERQQLDGFVEAFEVLALPWEIAAVAGLWRRQYGRSHGTGLADALIAASVEAAQATLVTLNRRHFPMLANVWVPYAKPGSA